jgi:hypothetical protein
MVCAFSVMAKILCSPQGQEIFSLVFSLRSGGEVMLGLEPRASLHARSRITPELRSFKSFCASSHI